MNDVLATKLNFIKSVLANYLDSSTKIILFGSYANKTHHQHSDIDIAIKGERPLNTSVWSQLEEVFAESPLKQKVDLVDYHRVSEPFKKVIDEQGIELN